MAIPFLNHITLNQNEARDFGMHLTESSDIATPVAGQLIFDNGTGQDIMKYYDGSQWISVGADTDNFVDEVSLTGTTLTLARTGALADLTVDIGSIDTNDFLTALSFDTNDGVLTATVSNQSDVTVDLDGRYQIAGNYDNYLNWQISDGSQTDDVVSNQIVKFAANASAGTAGVVLTGDGSSADPYLITYTFPNDNDVDYVDEVTFDNNTLTFSSVGNAFDGTVDLSTLADTVREVSVDTNGDGTVNNTLEDSESLVLKKGNNITLTEAGGVITISSADTVDMGDGFIVSADTNSNATTITEGETLTIAGGTNVTTETTADGTVTINSSFTNTDTLQNISVDNTNADRFITTVANESGPQEGLSHSTLKYNPSTETLSVTNLIISGTSTTVNTEIINLADNIITLNSNATGDPSENAGIEVERGDSTNVSLNWNETDDDWEFTAANHAATPAVVTYKIPRTFAATVGDGTLTDIPVIHNLGTRQVIVQLYDTSSYETVYADVVRTDDNTVTLTFASAPATGDITVLISTAGV